MLAPRSRTRRLAGAASLLPWLAGSVAQNRSEPGNANLDGNGPALSSLWTSRLAPFRRASNSRALLQLIPTAALFALVWWAMTWSLRVSYPLTMVLAVVDAALLVRLFIFFHDCAHGSFFRGEFLNHAVGGLLGVLTMTPFRFWKRHHVLHHATAGNLDRRGTGDIGTLTIREYLSLTTPRRFAYRLQRTPIVFLLAGPLWLFMIRHRFPIGMPLSWSREWRSVAWNNVGIVAVVAAMVRCVGVGPFLAIQIPVFLLSAIAGLWLFHVQHQFESTYWRREHEWDFTTACVEGSSHLALPQPLRWFTGDIGIHHIHHLCSSIPNYRLARSMEAVADLEAPRRVTLWQSLRCARLALWDEDSRRLVAFAALKRMRAERRRAARPELTAASAARPRSEVPPDDPLREPRTASPPRREPASGRRAADRTSCP